MGFDVRAQGIIRDHIDDVMALLERIAAGNLEDKLQKQTRRLQEKSQAVESMIERKRAVIRSLESSIMDGIVTLEEADELRTSFESEQASLEQKRHALLEQIQQIQDGTVLQCKWAECFMPYREQTTFSHKDIAMLVEAIFLHRDKRIEIRFVHDQEFQYIQQMLG